MPEFATIVVSCSLVLSWTICDNRSWWRHDHGCRGGRAVRTAKNGRRCSMGVAKMLRDRGCACEGRAGRAFAVLGLRRQRGLIFHNVRAEHNALFLVGETSRFLGEVFWAQGCWAPKRSAGGERAPYWDRALRVGLRAWATALWRENNFGGSGSKGEQGQSCRELSRAGQRRRVAVYLVGGSGPGLFRSERTYRGVCRDRWSLDCSPPSSGVFFFRVHGA